MNDSNLFRFCRAFLSRAHTIRLLGAGGLLAILMFFAGCATPVSYRLRPDAGTKTAAFRVIAVVAPDAEVSEISAGGVTEIRDEWSAKVSQNLSQALTEQTGYKSVEALDPALKAELDETAALLRAITLNQIFSMFNPGLNRAGPQPLSYSLGSIDKLADACGADALLFVFVRDSYATAGRKALAVLGVIGAGFTGVAIIPQMGTTLTSAALVERDGTVLWFNVHGAASGDLRQMEGARNTVQTLLAGLPGKKSNAHP